MTYFMLKTMPNPAYLKVDNVKVTGSKKLF